MKSKFTTYTLIVVVIAVWGVIIFKLIAKNDDDVPKEPIAEKGKTHTKIVDTLNLKYEDPFKIEKQPLVETKIENITVKTVARETLIPKYIGKIKKRNVINILLELHDIQYALKQGDTLNGFCLFKIYDDSIQLLKNGNIYTCNDL